MRLMPKAANSICAAKRPKMATNIRRNFSLGTFMRMRAPSTAPMTEPNAMGAATGVTISPRAKYAAALAAAVHGHNRHDENPAGHAQHSTEHAGAERHREQPPFKADRH